MQRISVMIAFFNEAENIGPLRERITKMSSTLDAELELVLVDDHSTDASSAMARRWAEEEPGIHYLRLSHRCGPHAAMAASLTKCTGDCAIMTAADLQDPPELIPRLVEHWQEGNDVVLACRSQPASQSLILGWLGNLFYFLCRIGGLPNMPKRGVDFALIDRRVIDAYHTIPEKTSNIVAMMLWMGFRQSSFEYVKQPRHAGHSKWNMRSKIRLAIDTFVSFSRAPTWLMGGGGLLALGIGTLQAIWMAVSSFRGHSPESWSVVLLVILMMGGFQLIMLGVLGEYLSRALDEARGRPQFMLEEYLPPREMRARRAPQELSSKGVSTTENGDAPPGTAEVRTPESELDA